MKRDRALLLGLLAAASAAACGPAPVRRQPVVPLDAGEAFFNGATFSGNGRSCATCHSLDAFGTLTPERVRELYASSRSDPIFRPIDSDDGLGNDYERLRAHATIRVHVPLEPDPATGLAIRRCDAPQEREAVLHRGMPTVYNSSLDGNLMADGRQNADLVSQALDAVVTHLEPGSAPTEAELAAITEFERSLFSNAGIPRAFRDGSILEAPEGTTESEMRGQGFFDGNRPCGLCHSGALMNRTSRWHPTAVSFDFASSLVGQEPDNPNPKHDWCFVDPSTNRVVTGPHGSERVFDRPTADPGAAVLPGFKVYVSLEDRLDSIPNAELAAMVGGPPFKIPMLWGVASTAPYFHDNSAKTLEDVVDQYNFLFRHSPLLARAAGCDPTRADCMSEQDKADLVAYLRLLTFDGPGVRVAPSPAPPS